MKEKISHLSKELQEFFPKNSGGEVGKKLEQLKKIEPNFGATSGFKTSLKSRLKNIYDIEYNPVTSKFSWFQYAGLLSSFLFVSGVGYIFYTTQQQSIEDIVMSEKIEESTTGGTMMSDMMISESTTVQVVENLEKETILSRELSPKNTSENSKTVSVKKVSPTPEIYQKKSPTLPSEEVSQKSIPEGNTSDTQSDMISSDSLEDSAQNPSEDSATMMIQSSIMMDEVPVDDRNNASSESVSEMRMMDTSASDRFYELCASYSGTVLLDDSTCQFGGERSCSRENLLSENPELCEFLIQQTQNIDSEK